MATYAIAAQLVSGFKARIKVTVTSPTPGALMTIERVWGDRTAPVAGAIDVPAVSMVVDDAELPLGREVVYRLRGTDTIQVDRNRKPNPQAALPSWSVAYGTGGAGATTYENGLCYGTWSTSPSGGTIRVSSHSAGLSTPVTPGEQIVISAAVDTPVAGCRLGWDYYTAAGAWISYASVPLGSGVYRATVAPQTVPANAGQISGPYLTPPSTASVVPGWRMGMGRVKIGADNRYLDGETTYDPLLTPSWTGTPNASESIVSAPLGWDGRPASSFLLAESELPVLSEPVQTGGWAPVAVTDWGEQTNPDRAEALRIEGSSHVVIVRDIEVDPSLPLVVETDTLADEQAVQAIGRTGMPLLLRWPADHGEDDAWLQSIGGRRRYRLSLLSPVVRHSWSTMQTVLPDLTRRAASDTLGDLERFILPSTTLGAIAARWATLGAIAATDLKTEG